MKHRITSILCALQKALKISPLYPTHLEHSNTHRQHVKAYTWEKMCFEALLGHSIIRLELDSHVVELGRDHFGHFSSTELAV